MKQKILVLLTLCIVALFSCSDGDDPIKEIEKPPIEVEDPFIKFDVSSVSFTNEGGEKTLSFETNLNWTITSSESWCKVSPTSGTKGSKSVAITTNANEEYDDRSCTLTIKGGNVTKTIAINQGENFGLLISQDRYELNNEETTIEVEVMANVEFEVVIPEASKAWIERVETRGLVETKLLFLIHKNEEYDGREGSINIRQTDGDLESTITVFQSQKDAIILSERVYDILCEAQQIEVEVKTNIDFEVVIPQDAQEWVSIAQTRALRTETVALDITENRDAEARSTEVYFKNRETTLQDTLLIKQAACGNLVVDDQGGVIIADDVTIEVPQGAFTGEVTVEITKKPPHVMMDEYEASNYYEVKIPKDFTKPLKVQLPANTQVEGDVYFCFATTGYQTSGQKETYTTHLVKATKVGDVYEALLDPFDIPEGDDSNYDDENIIVGLVKDYTEAEVVTRSAATKFSVFCPRFYESYIEFLKQSVSESITILSGVGYNFDKRVAPLRVVVKPFGNDDGFGYFEQSLYDNWSYVAINGKKLEQTLEMKRTIIHELTHFSQSYFDPRNQFSKAKLEGNFLWMSEAIAVWAESLYVDDLSIVQVQNQIAPLEHGFYPPAGNSGNRQNHGYGMAGLIHWLAKKNDNSSIVNLDVAQMNGAKDAYGAFKAAFPTLFDSYNYVSFLHDYVRGGGVDGLLLISVPKLTIADMEEYITASPEKAQRFSAFAQKINFHPDIEFPDDLSGLEIVVEGGKGDYCDLLKFSESTRQLELIKTFNDSYTYNDVNDIKAIHNNREALYVVYYHPYSTVSAEPLKVKAQLVEKEPKITFTTTKNSGETITLLIDAADEDKKDVWIDLNNNGKRDEGEEVTNFNNWAKCTIESQVVSVYGKLKTFDCYDGQVTSLDVGTSNTLQKLVCSHNELTSLDVSGCPNLNYLACTNNNIAVLNLNSSSPFEYLFCDYNQITSLDVSGYPNLKELGFGGNKISAINLSNCTELEGLFCFDNNLTTLDVSNSPAIKTLYCFGNEIQSLNVSSFASLKELRCYDNELTSLNLNGCSDLKWLNCKENNLATLDVKECASLAELDCSDNELAELDVSGMQLEKLRCNNNKISSLNVSNSNKLKYLYCNDNELVSLDVNNNTTLTTVMCYNNQLTTLNVDGCTKLHQLYCENNGLLGIVPAIFDDIGLLEYDIRYRYKYDSEKKEYVMIEDTGKGYWYGHEPAGGCHSPDPCNPL